MQHSSSRLTLQEATFPLPSDAMATSPTIDARKRNRLERCTAWISGDFPGRSQLNSGNKKKILSLWSLSLSLFLLRGPLSLSFALSSIYFRFHPGSSPSPSLSLSCFRCRCWGFVVVAVMVRPRPMLSPFELSFGSRPRAAYAAN